MLNDNEGNTLEFKKVFDDRLEVLLTLKGKRPLRIGVWDEDSKTFYKWVKEEHVMRVNKSVGFCHQAIEVLNPSQIAILYDGERGRIDRDTYEKNKKFLFIKQQGYELQAFIPIELFYAKEKANVD